MKKICTIYRSSKKEGMYLYVDRADDLSHVPEALLKQFGAPQHAMVLVLHPERKLARVSVEKVLAELEEKGFYLQMPPALVADEMTEMHQKNSKIGG